MLYLWSLNFSNFFTSLGGIARVEKTMGDDAKRVGENNGNYQTGYRVYVGKIESSAEKSRPHECKCGIPKYSVILVVMLGGL